MKLRIASVAVLLGTVSTGLIWLTLQPSLLRLLEVARRTTVESGPDAQLIRRVQAALPFVLALDFVAVVLVCFVVLFVVVGRPVRDAEAAVEQLGRLDLELSPAPAGGPLLSRLQAALRRMADALREERALTRRQVDELRQMNDRLARAQTELASSEQLATVGRLAAGVAHEVGNPLSGILGYLSLVRSRTAARDQEVAGYAERIEHEVQRIDRIVRGLLDLGRPARGTAQIVPVGQVVESCARLAGAGADFARVRLAVEVAAECVARAEPGPLSQVVLNLLLNAAQAMGGEGDVQVRGWREGEEVLLEVRDRGPGLTEEVKAHLFEPFFTTKQAGKGTGLGLAVSRHLVQTMDGRLEAENAPGGGALFRIRLRAA